MSKPANKRAYLCKVKNLNARTSSSKEYFSLFVEGGEPYLFTVNDLKKAGDRAKKNPEDVVIVSFAEPEPIIKEVIKEIEVIKEVPQKGLLGKIFGGMFN